MVLNVMMGPAAMMADNSSEDLFFAAIGHQQAGRLGEAGTVYREIVTRQPEQADALHLLAIVEFLEGSKDAALQSIRSAISLQPGVGEYHYHLGWMLAGLGRNLEAIEPLSRAIQLRPDLAEAHNNLGEVLRRLRQWELAIRAFHKALEVKPDYT